MKNYTFEKNEVDGLTKIVRLDNNFVETIAQVNSTDAKYLNELYTRLSLKQEKKRMMPFYVGVFLSFLNLVTGTYLLDFYINDFNAIGVAMLSSSTLPTIIGGVCSTFVNRKIEKKYTTQFEDEVYKI